MNVDEGLENPFPGLRPFEESDNLFFFGRDAQIEELLERLERRRFIAVIGTSASGKSSLVRAGLLPALRGGFMVGAGSRWRIAVMRPGFVPIDNLASALETSGVLGSEGGAALRVGLARAVLERGELGLVEVVEQADLRDDENVLVVVDQFEELFRFERDLDEAAAFVKLLLAGAAYTRSSIYVLLTMRSDFLGDCAQFRDLPETINDGLFLVPRLTREQSREAIEGPIGVAGGEISPLLANRLLNELGDSPDQLPVLQHALLRTWDSWKKGGADRPIDDRDFDSTGGLALALSTHGDDIYDDLPVDLQPVAERVFKALTMRGSDGRDVRRPTTLSALPAIAGASLDDVTAVVEAFRKQGRSFLMPPPGVALAPATVVDVSHESLMRLWGRLRAWVDQEAESAQTYRRLADMEHLHERGETALLADPALGLAEHWRAENEPTPAWAERYAPGFDAAMRYLDASLAERERLVRVEDERSEREREAERRRFEMEETSKRERAEREAALASARADASDQLARRTRRSLVITSAVALVAILLGAYSFFERNRSLEVQSLFLARDSQSATDGGNAVAGALFALEALPKHFLFFSDRPYVPQAEFALENALANQRESMDIDSGAKHAYSAMYSPDGSRVVVGNVNSSASIVDARTGDTQHVMLGHQNAVSFGAFSPDGKRVVTAADDDTARVWDAATGKELFRLTGHTDSVNTAVFSPDGTRIVTASADKTARVWDARDGRELVRLHAMYPFRGASFSPDGRLVVTGGNDFAVKVWDSATGAERLTCNGHTQGVLWASYSPDGLHIVSASNDHTVRIWNARNCASESVLRGHDDTVEFASYSPDGRHIVSASDDKTVRIWDAATGAETTVLRGNGGYVYTASFSPDGRRIVSASYDGTVRFWNIDGAGETAELDGHTDYVPMARFSPDGKRVASASWDGTARVWDIASRKTITTFRGHGEAALAVAFSPDGTRVVSGGIDNMVRVWDAKTGKPFLALRGHTKRVADVRFSPDGKRIVSASWDGTARVWDAVSGKQLFVLRGHQGDVFCATFSPDGRTIATGGADADVRMWDAATGAPGTILNGHEFSVFSVAFSADGRRIVSASLDKTMRIWNVSGGDAVAVLRGHDGAVYSAAFSPDGKRIVSGSADSTVRVWDAPTGMQIASLRGHESLVYSTEFSPDGTQILSASQDTTIRVWSMPRDLDTLTENARNRLPRTLTDEERAAEYLNR